MSTCLHLKCGGCFAEAHTAPIRRTFVSFNGLGHGYGRHQEPDIDKAVEPTGWIWSDPYTGCTYCPACWKEIMEDSSSAPRESGSKASDVSEPVNTYDNAPTDPHHGGKVWNP